MTVLHVIGALLLVAGMLFICVAALGLLRFRDALQRMHASTKAGTLGSGLSVLGAVLVLAEPGVTAVGLVTVVFLLLTVPVAGHLLGRAAYVSGAELSGVGKRDELKGVLEREEQPLERRTGLEEQR
jgi:multicomponent Na+:H+ antiporter subunit G